jgi:hypothetical protein
MKPTQYAAVVYWYSDKNSTDPLKPVCLEDRVDYYKNAMYPLDCDGMLVLEKPYGRVIDQGMGGFQGKWTDGKQLWWEAEKPDEVLRIGFFVPENGSYELYSRFTKAVDYGKVKLYVNDEPVGNVYDLYQPEDVGQTEEIKLGPVEMKKGINILKVKMVGKNPDAYGRYMFGMDYLKVLKAD